MSFNRRWIGAGATLCSGLVAAHFAWSQALAPNAHSRSKDRARIVFSQPLSKLDGDHLKVTLVKFVTAQARHRYHILTLVPSLAMSSKGRSEPR